MRLLIAFCAVLVVLLTACGSRGADPAPDVMEALPRAGEADLAGDPAATPAPASTPPAEAEPAVEAEPEPEPVDPLALPAEGPPVAPDDPAALAGILTTAELAIRDSERSADELGAAGHWQQVAIRRLVSSPELVDLVLAEVPGELHAAVRGNVFAGSRLAAMHAPADPSAQAEVRELPRWRILEPPSADELRSYYEEAQAATGVHWTYLAAINLVETRMGRIRGDSVAGAQGPMQFMPATWGEWGQGDVHDPRDAIMAAGRYLRWGGMPGDVNGAIFRYNRDVRYVDAVRTYAEQMQAGERAFYGYYHWQVYYFTGESNVWLAPGYDATAS